jgi:hypothetical protein
MPNRAAPGSDFDADQLDLIRTTRPSYLKEGISNAIWLDNLTVRPDFQILLNPDQNPIEKRFPLRENGRSSQVNCGTIHKRNVHLL